MVVIHNFQDIYETLNRIEVLTLPKFKENFLNIEFISSNDKETISQVSDAPLPFASSGIFNASIIKWRRLTAEDVKCKIVYEISFDIQCSNFDFMPGDTIGIIPHNNEHEVQEIINHLGIHNLVDLNYKLSINNGQKGKIPLHVPVESTLRYVLTNCVDLRGVLKKLFLLALSRYTKDPNEKRVLEYLCSKEGSTDYTTHILNRRFMLQDLFTIFKTCKPPIELVLEHLPRLLPRPYSIVNGRHEMKNIIKICFSVTNIGNNRKGITTGWLEEIILKKNGIEDQMEHLSLNKNIKIPMYLRKNINGFNLPENMEIPLIFIGPGTGIAPFIGFLEEREYFKKLNPDIKFGFVWLFFGCRDPKLDFIYEDELKNFALTGAINKLSTAYSRIENAEFCYVQHAIREYGAELTKLIMQGAHVYVCGDIQVMATQVKDTFIKVIEKHGNISIKEAEEFVSKMQKEKKYVNDIWN